MTSWTLDDINRKQKAGTIVASSGVAVQKIVKESKYKNKRCEWGGKKFMSEWERDKYIELYQLERSGHITDLQCQVKFELNPGGTFSYKYYADFCYYDREGKYCVIDTKGYITKEYKKKRALILKVHGITIIELKKKRK